MLVCHSLGFIYNGNQIMQVVYWIKSWKQNKVQHLDKLIVLLIVELSCHCRKFAFIWVQKGMISFPVLDLSASVSASGWVTMNWEEMLVIPSSVTGRLEAEKQWRFAFLLNFKLRVLCKSSCLKTLSLKIKCESSPVSWAGDPPLVHEHSGVLGIFFLSDITVVGCD